MSNLLKYRSDINPLQHFWAQAVETEQSNRKPYVVLSQVEGAPVTEAYDDWFQHFSDADEVARKLANGEILDGFPVGIDSQRHPFD
jgi:hypothetical protein